VIILVDEASRAWGRNRVEHHIVEANLLGEGDDNVQHFSDRTHVRSAREVMREIANVARSALRAVP